MVDLHRLIRAENLPPEALREWLVENGLGGYASATMTGAITRRYHGFLIAAQPAPLGRMVVLNDLEVDIERGDGEPPFTPRGCIAQAWSVAEVLRCLQKTAVEPE